ncbi:MAG TPA: hypothetical protein VGI85_06375 [Chthoniobacterales bacterium]
MSLLRAAVLPGAVAGLICIFTSWLWMGLIFHRYQARTPESWRRENNLSYGLSSAIHIFACIVAAVLFRLVVADGNLFFGAGVLGALRFGALLWMAMAAPLAIDAGVFVRLHPWVVVGQLIDWLTTSLLACVVTAVWSGR